MGEESKPPLYVVVQRALMARIEEREYRIGSRLPTEGDLCREFQVSRHTVREALRNLRNAGYLSSRQGSGYTVESVAAEHRYIHAVASLDELLQYVSNARMYLLEIGMIETDAALATRLNCSPERKWLRLCGVRKIPSSAKPIGLVEAFIHASYAGIRRHLEDHEGPLFSLIQSTYGERIKEVVQTMRAATIPARYAKVLLTEPGSPALEIERVFKSSTGKVVEISFNYHGIGRFGYTSVFRSET